MSIDFASILPLLVLASLRLLVLPPLLKLLLLSLSIFDSLLFLLLFLDLRKALYSLLDGSIRVLPLFLLYGEKRE